MSTTSDNSDHGAAAAAVLARLHGLQSTPLTLQTLSEPLTSPSVSAHDASSHRTSDSSQSQLQPQSPFPDAAADQLITPATLSADLAHYRDLFSKLRFSYLEQVTKEKYLRSIVGDPPLLVTHDDNAALEQRLAGMKSALAARKEAVDALVAEMEGRARDVAAQADSVRGGTRALETLPGEIEALRDAVSKAQAAVAEARRAQGLDDGSASADPRLDMGLERTEAAVREMRARNEQVDAEIAALQRALPGKTREAEKLDRELVEVERRRTEAARAAREVQLMREQGRDEVGDVGRWYRAAEGVMGGMGVCEPKPQRAS